jgi:hypothetical protein
MPVYGTAMYQQPGGLIDGYQVFIAIEYVQVLQGVAFFVCHGGPFDNVHKTAWHENMTTPVIRKIISHCP